jgi:hypothetical protein
VPPGYGHGDGEDAEADALEPPTDDQFGEVVRHRGHHAAGDHTGEGEEDHVPLPGPVGQPAHDRRHERPGQQGDGEQPFARTQGHVVGVGQRRDERSAQAGHDRHQGACGHQGGHEEPGVPLLLFGACCADLGLCVQPFYFLGVIVVIDRCHQMLSSDDVIRQ